MVTNLLKDGAGGRRQAARRGSKGKMIHQALKGEIKGNEAFYAIISQNAKLIQTVSETMAERLSAKMRRLQTKQNM